MKKELLRGELRDSAAPGENSYECLPKTITSGIYDTIGEAVYRGNELLKLLSKHFEVRSGDKFAVRGLFGLPDRLVSNNCYPTKGVANLAKITEMHYVDVESVILEAFETTERYRQYLRNENE